MKLVFEENQSVIYDEGKVAGYCSLVEEGDVWTIDHTVVEESYQGQGLAKRLLYEVLEQAKKQHKKIVPQCSYAAHQFEKDASIQELLKDN